MDYFDQQARFTPTKKLEFYKPESPFKSRLPLAGWKLVVALLLATFLTLLLSQCI